MQPAVASAGAAARGLPPAVASTMAASSPPSPATHSSSTAAAAGPSPAVDAAPSPPPALPTQSFPTAEAPAGCQPPPLSGAEPLMAPAAWAPPGFNFALLSEMVAEYHAKKAGKHKRAAEKAERAAAQERTVQHLSDQIHSLKTEMAAFLKRCQHVEDSFEAFDTSLNDLAGVTTQLNLYLPMHLGVLAEKGKHLVLALLDLDQASCEQRHQAYVDYAPHELCAWLELPENHELLRQAEDAGFDLAARSAMRTYGEEWEGRYSLVHWEPCLDVLPGTQRPCDMSEQIRQQTGAEAVERRAVQNASLPRQRNLEALLTAVYTK